MVTSEDILMIAIVCVDLNEEEEGSMLALVESCNRKSNAEQRSRKL